MALERAHRDDRNAFLRALLRACGVSSTLLEPGDEVPSGGEGDLDLGQRLLRERAIGPEVYLRAQRLLDRPLLTCPRCNATLSPGETLSETRDQDGAFRCGGCGEPLDALAQLDALDPGALETADAGSASTTPSVEESTAPARTLQAGDRLGGYEIEAPIGHGGMGVIYRARQLELDRVVALKVLRAGLDATAVQIERFQREARAAAKLTHPHIVSVHEVGIARGLHFFSMDLVEGPSLKTLLDEGRAPSPRETARLVATIGRALAYAHERGVIHRDVKPGNVLLEPGGSPRLTDFGLAKVQAQETLLTRSGVAIGTPLYMSPEQARGDHSAIGPASDVYGLGAVLFHLLTGQVPFGGRTQAEVYGRILRTEPPLLRKLRPGLPRDLEVICLKTLEKQPEDRYATADELADDLERWLRGAPIIARRQPLWRRAGRALVRHSRWITAALLVTGLASLALAGLLTRRARRRADLARRADVARVADRTRLLAEIVEALAAADARAAIAAADTLIARDPESPEAASARLQRARALWRIGRAADALEAFSSIYIRDRTPARRAAALDGIATALYQRGEPAAAARAARRRLQRYPNEGRAAAARVALARAALTSGRPGAALRALPPPPKPEPGAASSAPSSAAELADLTRIARLLRAPVTAPGADLGLVADPDGDGRADLVVLAGDTVRVYGLIDGELQARAQGRLPIFATWERIIAADVDRDGGDELVGVGDDPIRGRTLTVVSLGLRPEPEADLPLRAGQPQPGSSAAAPPSPDAMDPGIESATPRITHAVRLEGFVPAGGLIAGDVDGDGRVEIFVREVRALGESGAYAGSVRLYRPLDGGGLRAERVLSGARAGDVRAFAVRPAAAEVRAVLWVLQGQGRAAEVREYGWAGRAPALIGRAPAPGATALLVRTETGAAWTAGLDRADATLAPTGHAGSQLSIGPIRDRRRAASTRTFHVPLPGRWRLVAASLGDVFASGSDDLLALAARIDSPRPEAALLVLRGASGGHPPAGAPLVVRWPDPAPTWAAVADLDADGDVELIVGGRERTAVYGGTAP